MLPLLAVSCLHALPDWASFPPGFHSVLGLGFMFLLLYINLVSPAITGCPFSNLSASLNFLKLCKIKYYNYCLFHNVQVIPSIPLHRVDILFIVCDNNTHL